MARYRDALSEIIHCKNSTSFGGFAGFHCIIHVAKNTGCIYNDKTKKWLYT